MSIDPKPRMGLFAKLRRFFFGDENQTRVLRRMHQLENAIMSAISDFAAKQKAFNDRQSAAIDSLVQTQSGLTADIQALNDKITELQNSAGGVTPEDQALIDELEAQGNALSERADSVAAALKALDEQTPPVAPNA